jgi:hypothetical protein
MLGDVVCSNSAVRQVFRERIRALGITYDTADAIAGLTRGYTQKCLSEPPAREMGTTAMWLIAGALGICFVPIVDHQQSSLVKARWTRRQRSHAPECVSSGSEFGDAERDLNEVD